ncbi:MAG: hypothetical protein LBP63_05365 [Prevotellaceae bacterium]|nr:hypothetical protein [Prevotellaceae bacterium]
MNPKRFFKIAVLFCCLMTLCGRLTAQKYSKQYSFIDEALKGMKETLQGVKATLKEAAGEALRKVDEAIKEMERIQNKVKTSMENYAKRYEKEIAKRQTIYELQIQGIVTIDLPDERLCMNAINMLRSDCSKYVKQMISRLPKVKEMPNISIPPMPTQQQLLNSKAVQVNEKNNPNYNKERDAQKKEIVEALQNGNSRITNYNGLLKGLTNSKSTVTITQNEKPKVPQKWETANINAYVDNVILRNFTNQAEIDRIHKEAEKIDCGTLNKLVEGIDFPNWHSKDNDEKTDMLKKLANNYLSSRYGIENFTYVTQNNFKFESDKTPSQSNKETTLGKAPIISKKPVEAGLIAQCHSPDTIKDRNGNIVKDEDGYAVMQSKIEINTVALQNNPDYEVIGAILHEARHAYQLHQIYEYYSNKAKKNIKANKNTIDQWRTTLNEYQRILDRIKKLEEDPSSKTDAVKKEELRNAKSAKEEMYKIMSTEKDANRTAAIFLLALQKKYADTGECQ